MCVRKREIDGDAATKYSTKYEMVVRHDINIAKQPSWLVVVVAKLWKEKRTCAEVHEVEGVEKAQALAVKGNSNTCHSIQNSV